MQAQRKRLNSYVQMHTAGAVVVAQMIGNVLVHFVRFAQGNGNLVEVLVTHEVSYAVHAAQCHGHCVMHMDEDSSRSTFLILTH